MAMHKGDFDNALRAAHYRPPAILLAKGERVENIELVLRGWG
jgi:hypothetical protein